MVPWNVELRGPWASRGTKEAEIALLHSWNDSATMVSTVAGPVSAATVIKFPFNGPWCRCQEARTPVARM
ncbi:hypothetical protein StoSoilB3_25570 [Arthrobacter sp. StoSoilB3]|nr:hypothetical protein NtRootA2_24630 [Arthrobacter sp. NtRootA2]BCW32136.1 hypothetical protein NtRootD5_24670 [Arthrobacter sp. NtRootD5]BCW41022.1 hypothetical protein StoSoilB3_25570 [Arthrobacter sp. StoSoilB3]